MDRGSTQCMCCPFSPFMSRNVCICYFTSLSSLLVGYVGVGGRGDNSSFWLHESAAIKKKKKCAPESMLEELYSKRLSQLEHDLDEVIQDFDLMP